MLPFAKITEEMNDLIVTSDGQTRASHIYDSLDAEFEQDNQDAEDEESEFLPLPQTNFNINEESGIERNEKDSGKYKFLTLKEEDERLQITRDLVPEQMMVLQEVVKFCKLSTISKLTNIQCNSNLRLIVHGGAG